MATIWALFYLAIILLLGYTTLCLARWGRENGNGRPSLTMIVALSGICGVGTLGFVLFWISLLGLVPSFGVVFVVGLLAAITLATWFWRRGRAGLVLPEWKGRFRVVDLLALFPLALIAYILITAFASAWYLPMDEWDAWAIWQLKAKILTHVPLSPTPDIFHDLTIRFSHLRYPLMVPTLVAGLWGTVGQQDESLARMLLGLFYLLLPVILYSTMRWRLGRTSAMLLTAAQVALPTVFHWGMAGTADLAVTTFYAASVCLLIKWIDQRQTPDLVLMGLLSAFAAFTKNEGLALAALNVLVVVLFAALRRPRPNRQGWLTVAAVAAGMLLIMVPWFVWSHSIPAGDEDYASKLTPDRVVSNLSRLPQISAAFWDQFSDPARWGSFWLLAPCAALLGFKAWRQPNMWALWILALLHLGLYIMIYIIYVPTASMTLQGLFDTSLDRVLLHITPVITLIFAWHWASVSAPAPGHARSS